MRVCHCLTLFSVLALAIACGPNELQPQSGVPVCGDGRIQEGEECDGGDDCTAWCLFASRFSEPLPLNSNASVDFGDDLHLSLMTDGRENVIVVWLSSDPMDFTIGLDSDVFWSRRDADTQWTPAAVLNPNAAADEANDSFWADLAADGDGVITWSSFRGRGALSTADAGQTWVEVPYEDASGRLAQCPERDCDRVVASDTGTTVRVGTSTLNPRQGAEILYSRSTDGGVTWSADAILDSNAPLDGRDANFPAVATDGNGRWLVAWSSDLEVRYAVSEDDAATWRETQTLRTNARDAWQGEVRQAAVDSGGNWVLVWNDGGQLQASLSGGELDEWSEPMVPTRSTRDCFAEACGGIQPHLVFDGRRFWFVWSTDDDFGGTVGPDHDIFYTYFELPPREP